MLGPLSLFSGLRVDTGAAESLNRADFAGITEQFNCDDGDTESSRFETMSSLGGCDTVEVVQYVPACLSALSIVSPVAWCFRKKKKKRLQLEILSIVRQL